MASAKKSFDFVVAGTGVVGMNIARMLGKEFPKCSILIVDKDKKVGYNASSRNSGVLHAGFYYKAGTMKGTICQEGNQRWTEFCKQYDLPYENLGKLCVPRNFEDQEVVIPDMVKNAAANNCPIEIVDPQQAREIDPDVYIKEGVTKVLWSPTSSIASPVAMINKLSEVTLEENSNIQLGLNTAVQEIRQTQFTNEIDLVHDRHNKETVEAKFFVNATGTHADRIAKTMGFAKNLAPFPVKGFYVRHNDFKRPCKTLVYPGSYHIADLIHTTPVTDGYMKIGPVFWPSLTRDSECASWRDYFTQVGELSWTYTKAFFSPNGKMLVDFARKGLPLNNPKNLVERMNTIWKVQNPQDFTTWTKPILMPNLFNSKTWEVEIDFIIQNDGQSLHTLNTVSPCWTSSIPYAERCVAKIKQEFSSSRQFTTSATSASSLNLQASS